MNKMKNIIDKFNWRFIAYLIYAIVAVSFLSINAFATCSTTGSGTGSLGVAKFYYSANLGSSEDSDVQTFYQVSRTNDIQIPIEISNKESDGNFAQVGLSYSIAITGINEDYSYSLSSEDDGENIALQEKYTLLGYIPPNPTIEDLRRYSLSIEPNSDFGWNDDVSSIVVKIVVLFEQGKIEVGQ